MAVEVYKIREKEVNGKIVKEYYNEKLNVVLNIKVNEDEPYVVFDDQKKEILKGQELEAFKEANEEEFEELENELEEGLPGVSEFSVHVVENDDTDKIFDKFVYVFNQSDVVEKEVMVRGLKLDEKKDFNKQQVSSSAFKNAIKYVYDDNTFGHVKNASIFSYGIGNGMVALFKKFDYDVQVKFAKGTRANEEYKALKGKSEDDFDKKEAELDERLKQEALNLKAQADDEGRDFDEAKFVSDAKLALHKRDMYFISHNKFAIGNFLDPTKIKQKVYDGELREVINVDEAIEDIKMVQLGMMSQMLGNGNPVNAFEQFLDKNALKNGEYKFDEKAIDKFMKKNFLKDKDLEKIAVQEMTIKQFERNYNTINGIEEDAKKVDESQLSEEELEKKINKEKASEKVKYTNASNKGKKLIGEDKGLSDDEYATTFQSIVQNENIVENLNVYYNLTRVRETRSKAYAFFHPINNSKEKKLLNKIKNEISAKLVDGSKFKEQVDKVLDSNSSIEDRRKAFDNVFNRKLINEPLENKDYIKANYEKLFPHRSKENPLEIKPQVSRQSIEKNQDLLNKLEEKVEVKEAKVEKAISKETSKEKEPEIKENNK